MRSLIVLLAMARVAAAEPAPYPTELVARPIVLPSGVIEGGGALDVAVIDGSESGDAYGSFAFIPRVRAGFSGAEVEAATHLVLDRFQPDGAAEGDRAAFESVFLAGRYGVAPTISVGAEGTLAREGSPSGARLRLSSKQRLGAGGGLELTLAVGADRTRYLGFDPSTSPVYVDRVVEGGVRVQAQVTPRAAIEARAALRYVVRSSDNPDAFDDGAALGQDYGARIFAAASPILDVYAGVDVWFLADDLTAKTFTLGVMARRLP